jgi:transposase
MVDHIVDTSEPRGRMDIRIGVARRRLSVEAKGRVVAESYAPRALVSEVASRHEIAPQRLFAWRKAARSELLALPVDAATPFFVPLPTRTNLKRRVEELVTCLSKSDQHVNDRL